MKQNEQSPKSGLAQAGRNSLSEDLIGQAAMFAAEGAREYLRVHNLKADTDALLACIRSWVKIKLPEALHDAAQALECHMDKAAEWTFALTMRQAGIEAAKEASFPPMP